MVRISYSQLTTPTGMMHFPWLCLLHTHKSPSIENGNGSENISSAVLTLWLGKSDSEWLPFFLMLSAKTGVYSLQILDSQQVPVTLKSEFRAGYMDQQSGPHTDCKNPQSHSPTPMGGLKLPQTSVPGRCNAWAFEDTALLCILLCTDNNDDDDDIGNGSGGDIF